MPFAKLHDITISYQDTGVPVNTAESREDYTTLVLVHGHTFNSHVWEPVLPLLAANYRVIAYDRRHYGQTSTTSTSTSYTDSVDLLQLITHLRTSGFAPSKLVLLGWSGGTFAVFFATLEVPRDEPLPFDAILLYEAPFYFREVQGPYNQSTFARSIASYFDPITGELVPDKNSIDIIPQQLLEKCHEPDTQDIQVFAALMGGITHESVLSVLDRIPVGILYGSMTAKRFIDAAKEVEELSGPREGFSIMEMKGANHFAMTDVPDVFAETVQTILRRILGA